MKTNPIAIVGMACRYPDANSPAELWQNVLSGRRAFRRIPACRLSPSYLGPPDDPDRAYITHAAVLRDWDFDRETFGVPGPLHRAVDHTHWLALQTAAEALADAGHPLGEGLGRHNVGVIFGNTLTGEFSRASSLRLRWPFIADAAATALADSGVAGAEADQVLARMEQLIKQPFPKPGDDTLAGALSNTIAGRICNHFDFHGTGFAVDGACSSSLIAVMIACGALTAGELDFALAGAVDLSLDPFELVGFSRLGALATDDMRVYDARPTGFLPGEGCGVIALARAQDAERLGMQTYGHIVGWASSSDGAGGLTRPAAAGQALAIRRACRMATLPPSALTLIEGHGTGTAVGDQIELHALTEVRAHASERAALGTIKANIGHAKAAAGMAGLMKATLAAFHRVLPPTTGCVEPHQLLQQHDAPIRVLAEPEPWSDPTPRAGVSSMGFGGINVHVVVEGPTSSPQAALTDTVRRWSAPCGRYEIVLIDGASPTLLAERLNDLAIAARALSYAELRDIAATEWRQIAGRPKEFRAAMVAASPEQLAATSEIAASAANHWDTMLRIDRHRGYALGTPESPRIGLLFPGQAAPVRPTLSWWANTLDIPRYTADTDAIIEDKDCTGSAQPAIVRQSLAGVAWLRALGVTPVAAVGHSLGEITALYFAGALSAHAAMDLAAKRGRTMSVHGNRDSAMVSVAADAQTASNLLRNTDAVLACYNAPNVTTVSGRREEIERVTARAAEIGVRTVQLNVSHGFHGPAMNSAIEPLRQLLEDIPLTSPKSPVISTITGRELPASADELRELLVRQLTAPVQFRAALTELARRCDLLVETGPGTILSDLTDANDVRVPVVSLDCGGDDRHHALATAALATTSADLDVWFADRPYRPLSVTADPRFLVNPCENRSAWTEPSHTSASKALPQSSGAAESPSAPTDALETLISHLSESLELPADSITSSSGFLTDLHLSSLQAVQAVASVAATLGRQPPDIPFSLTEATIGQVVEILTDSPTLDSTPPLGSGVRSWVCAFEPRWVPFTVADAPPTAWHVHAPTSHWLHDHAATPGETPTGLAAVLTRENSEEIASLLKRVSDVRPERFLLIHEGHAAAAGVARNVAMELPHCWVTVIETPDVTQTLNLSAVTDSTSRYLELRTNDGRLERATIRRRRLGSGAPAYLSPGDICLVTGGVQGIAGYAAAALASRTGCALIFLGRRPATDPDVAAALSELDSDFDARYISCDVADEHSVERIVTEIRRQGTIRGLLHGAAVNEPRRLPDIDSATLTRTLRPKVSGLKTLLKRVGGDLKLLIGFGSIIGRQGLAGQAEYAIANDWLRIEMERWAAASPGCRTQHFEWSLWSELGMGARMNVLDSLRQQGVEPIEPSAGVAAMFDVLDDADAPVTVLVSSRFPPSPTVAMPRATESWWRFIERPKIDIPGVEVVAESDLSLGSDPYLADHCVDGAPLLPAVLGMEAMAQAAAFMDGEGSQWSLRNVEFRSPICVNERDGITIRTAALQTDDAAEVVLRDDSDRFSSVRFVGHITRDPGPTRSVEGTDRVPVPEKLPSSHPFYGNLLFHGPRFQRLIDYECLSAFRVSAWIRADQTAAWFSEFYGQDLLLGDPGAHDATLHVLLACLPHRRAIPVGVERMNLWHKPSGLLHVMARETSHCADSFTFDVELADSNGTLVAEWRGLQLRALGAICWPDGMARRLVGPWFSRRLIECNLANDVELVASSEGGTCTGAAAVNSRQKPCTAAAPNAGGLEARQAWSDASADTTVLALAERPIAVESVSVDDNVMPFLLNSLHHSDRNTAEALAAANHDHLGCASARVWTARTALAKLGHDSGEPLRVDQITDDSLTVLVGGPVQIVTCSVRITESDRPLVIAIATRQ